MYSNTPNPPAKFTATMWGKTVTIELDHSDINLNEVMDIFKGLTIASGFEMTSWNNVIKELSAEIYDEEHEIVKEALNTDEDDENEYKDLRHSFGNWVSDTDMGEDYDGQFDDWENETPNEDELNERMDIIGQNGNEGLHYNEDTQFKDYKGIHVTNPTFDWDNETNDILININDSIQIIKDKMEDIDLRMDNIDEQLGILNADVANIEFNIENPIKQTLIDGMNKYNAFNDVVDMENGEVSYDNDGGFGVKKLNKRIIKRGKIKDLKK